METPSSRYSFCRSFPADLSQIAEIVRLIDDWCFSNGLPDRLRGNLKLIADELVSNICRYGNVPSGREAICFYLDRTDDRIFLRIEDEGIPFNPLEQGKPDFSKPLEDRTPGGLGIFLVRELAEKMEYRRENDRNILAILLKVECPSNK